MPVKESKELLEALDAMKKEANKENAEKLSKLLDESIVYIPAVMPKNTDPAILRQMAGPAGKSMPVPKVRNQYHVYSRMRRERSFSLYLHQRRKLQKGLILLITLLL